MESSKTVKSVKCARCRNVHQESERVRVRDKSYRGLMVFVLVCPRCGCKSFYEMTVEVKDRDY